MKTDFYQMQKNFVETTFPMGDIAKKLWNSLHAEYPNLTIGTVGIVAAIICAECVKDYIDAYKNDPDCFQMDALRAHLKQWKIFYADLLKEAESGINKKE